MPLLSSARRPFSWAVPEACDPVWLQSPTPQSPPTRVAGTGGYDRFLLTFSKLELPERVSCFETLVHFQGKMGLLIRQCDQFCEAHDMFGLFCQMRDVCRQVLEMPHARLWQIDRERNSALCLYNNTVRGSIKAPVLALDLPVRRPPRDQTRALLLAGGRRAKRAIAAFPRLLSGRGGS